MDNHANFAKSLVVTPPSPALSGTSLTITAGTGVLFPAGSFNCVVCPANTEPTASNAEIIRVTTRVTDGFTVIARAQEGSTARTIVAGDNIFLAVTAKLLTDIEAVSLGGDVVGPASAATTRLASFNGTTGKLLADSGSTVTDILSSAASAAASALPNVTLAGTPTYITIAGQVITRNQITLTTDVTGLLPYANMVNATAASVLVGRGSASGAGVLQEITLGTSLSMSSQILNTIQGILTTSTPTFGGLGIGMVPDALFTVLGITAGSGVMRFYSYNGGGSAIIGYGANGTTGSLTAVAADDGLLLLSGRGYGSTGFTSGSRAQIKLQAQQTWTDSNQGTYISLLTTPNNSTSMAESARITGGGLFAIGKGTGTPTYGLHLAPTSGLTAGSTALFMDATASTGWTGVYVRAGAAQSTNAAFAVQDASSNNTFAVVPGVTGLSVTGAASSSGVTLTATGGTNESFKFITKGTGNLGIQKGTVALTPTALLHLYSTLTGGGIRIDVDTSLTPTLNSAVQFYRGNPVAEVAGFGVAGNTGSFSTGAIANDFVIYSYDAASAGYSLCFGTGSVPTVALKLSNTGKAAFGFGTGTPTYGLHLAPTSGLTAGQTAWFQDATASTGVTTVVIKAGANQSSTSLLTIQDGSGNAVVSIPSSAALAISGNFGPMLTMSRTDTSADARFQCTTNSNNCQFGMQGSGGGNVGFIWTGTAVPMVIGTNSTTRMTITTGGLFAFGTGTGTPTYGIHLAATSGLTAGQTVFIQDATASTGITNVLIKGGANQTTSDIFNIQDSSGNTLVGFKLATTGGSSSNFFRVNGTLPASPSGQSDGVAFIITGAGTSANQPDALLVQFAAGYTGSTSTNGVNCFNQNAGTGANIATTFGPTTAANAGVRADARATTVGSNVGVDGSAWGGNQNIGILGSAVVDKNSATNIGVLGRGLNAGSSPIQIGGYFCLANTAPTFTSAALMCDNGATTSSIFVARDNGTAVLTIADGGLVALGILANTAPALKPSSTILQARLADDSTFAPLQGKLRTDTNATTGLTAAVANALVNASVVVFAADGTPITLYGTV